jgi:quercetin dioxygenase-like cupin family protein
MWILTADCCFPDLSIQHNQQIMTQASDNFVHDADIEWEDLGDGIRRKILTFESRVMMARIAFEPGAIGVAHYHPHIQCSYVESGEFWLTISGRREKLVAGDSFLVPPDAVHGAEAITAGILIDVFTPMREDFLSPG